jgi:hypothetical protein
MSERQFLDRRADGRRNDRDGGGGRILQDGLQLLKTDPAPADDEEPEPFELYKYWEQMVGRFHRLKLVIKNRITY